MKNRESAYGFIRSLDPGLLWAGAAVGVSHVVQSTRAGASYQFMLVGVVILANIFKYPFFEFAPRYAAATGKSLLDAYLGMGRIWFYLFLLLTFATMFAITGAVTIVTAGLAARISGIALSPVIWSAILMGVCVLLLGLGSYSLLDRGIKYIIVVLSLSTLAAVFIALWRPSPPAAGFVPPVLFDKQGIAFMAALIGWMPSAIDISVWHSLWNLEKARISPQKPTFRQSLLDFNIGYLGTAFVALLFLALGALVMYGSGESLPAAGGAFADTFLSLYVKCLGSWAYPVVALAVFTTMFSTTITVLDAYPRVLKQSWLLLKTRPSDRETGIDTPYWGALLFTAFGALLLISAFADSMTFMVDLATTLSFLTAPVLAVLNYKVVRSVEMPDFARIPSWLNILSIVGILFLVAFALFYLYWRFVI